MPGREGGGDFSEYPVSCSTEADEAVAEILRIPDEAKRLATISEVIDRLQSERIRLLTEEGLGEEIV